MRDHGLQLQLPHTDGEPSAAEDQRIHDWYKFVLSFPPPLVRDYLDQLELLPRHRVLDPFSGTGTTLVECKKSGIAAVGIEANPTTHFAGRVKLDWSPSPDGLLEHAREVADEATSTLVAEGVTDAPGATDVEPDERSLRTLPPEAERLLIKDSISPLPLHKTLVLLECLAEKRDEGYHSHELLALARVLPTEIGNLRFGPEVGLGRKRTDVPVVRTWLAQVERMARDLQTVGDGEQTDVHLHLGDARDVMRSLDPDSIDGVITSPPYPNEKDYTRIVRLESVLLGFIRDKQDLRAMKQGLLRSNTRNVYKDDADDEWVAAHPAIKRIAEEIEARRIALGKNSGFERQYARVTKLYFGGMARHFAELRTALRPGARLAYVVGEQASYLRVMIRTGNLLAEIAESLGYEVTGIDLFRTRLATATKEQLREEVLLLRWPGA